MIVHLPEHDHRPVGSDGTGAVFGLFAETSARSSGLWWPDPIASGG